MNNHQSSIIVEAFPSISLILPSVLIYSYIDNGVTIGTTVVSMTNVNKVRWNSGF